MAARASSSLTRVPVHWPRQLRASGTMLRYASFWAKPAGAAFGRRTTSTMAQTISQASPASTGYRLDRSIFAFFESCLESISSRHRSNASLAAR
jgi:hypothetical protein